MVTLRMQQTDEQIDGQKVRKTRKKKVNDDASFWWEKHSVRNQQQLIHYHISCSLNWSQAMKNTLNK